jgi:hypothetical protein
MTGRTAGFRLSVVDVAFLAIAAAAFVLLRPSMGDGAWVIPFAAGHFFLFCNVFRVRRSYELAWTAVFLVNAIAWTAAGRFPWGLVTAVQAPFTIAAIALEMRSPAYHGILARRINPRLDEHLRG